MVLALVLVFAISCEPEAEHTHTYVEKTVEATCTEAGKTYKECSICGDIIEEKTISALGHSYEDKTDEATCSEAGKTYKECSVCGDIADEEVIYATGHSEELTKVVDTEPTEEAEGLYNYVCPSCGEVVDTEVISQLYFAEVFIPYGTEFETLSDSEADWICNIYKNGPAMPEKQEKSLCFEFKDFVFKENVVLPLGKVNVKEGSGSMSFSIMSYGDRIFNVNGTIVKTITVDEESYDVTMTYNDATFIDKYDSESGAYTGYELVDSESFSYTVNPENDTIEVNAEDVFAIFDASLYIELSEIFTEVDYEFSIKMVGKNACDSEIFRYAEIEKKTIDIGSCILYFIGEVESSHVAFGMDLDSGSFIYIMIDGKFYDVEKANAALTK